MQPDDDFIAILREWLGADGTDEEANGIEDLMAESEELAKRYQPE